MTKVNVNQLPQQGVKSLELQFPDGWDVHIANMNGHDRRPLTIDEVHASLQKPLGTKTLQELAKGKNE
ncbi:MAG: hypothetical protein V2J65_02275, partial [Desulfobacteraceae bacterium]|nr:hypothetical protein [Desulfobacteraceae bacterium]